MNINNNKNTTMMLGLTKDSKWSCLTYNHQDLQDMRQQYFLVENDHMQRFVCVLPQNDNVYFEELPLPPDEDSNFSC